MKPMTKTEEKKSKQKNTYIATPTNQKPLTKNTATV